MLFVPSPVAISLHGLTLLFWLSSLLVLWLRWWSPSFAALVRYGGRVDVGGAGSARRGSTRVGRDAAHTLVALAGSTWLGTVRVRRKTTFLLFYFTGCVSVVMLAWATVQRQGGRDGGDGLIAQLPLWCFGLHCLWRLIETAAVFRFKAKAQDNVSLFAAVSGAVFYVFAALSCDAVQTAPVGAADGSAVAVVVVLRLAPRIRLLLAAALNVLSLLFLMVHAAQAWAHASLASLRRRGRDGDGTEEEEAEEEEAEEERVLSSITQMLREAYGSDSAAREPILREPRLLQYHFPWRVNPLFRYVLEPHYTCEVLLYVLNGVAMGCVSWAYWASSGCGGATRGGAACEALRHSILLRLACAGCVLLFTACNLSLTAAEHRAFWQRVNAERARALQRLDESRAAATAASQHGRQRRSSEEESRLRACAVALREERLPPWNVLYGMC